MAPYDLRFHIIEWFRTDSTLVVERFCVLIAKLGNDLHVLHDVPRVLLDDCRRIPLK